MTEPHATQSVSPQSSDPFHRVMIVDDDRHILIAVKTVLNNAGFPVETAASGQECIDHLKRGFQGVILLDIMMPVLDGWDTIREIQREGFDNQVLIAMLTAKNTPDTKMIGLQEHVFDYIHKPFEPEELVEKVKIFYGYLNR